MHPATQNAIAGMISMMREALRSLEALLNADLVRQEHQVIAKKDEEDSRYLSNADEDLVAKYMELPTEER